MQAIVLAGGFGTRLKSVVQDVPKPMAPIGDQPFLSIILNKLSNAGFTKVVLAVGYKYQIIEEYFGDTYANMKIEYVIEEEPLGTGGALMYALQRVTADYVYVLNGDTLFDIDFKSMNYLDDITIAAKYIENNSRYGSLEIKNGFIHNFIEKGEIKSGYINGGIYRFNVNYLRKMDLPKKFSLERDLLENVVLQKPLRSFISDGYFIDIGIPEDYFKFIKDFENE